MMDEVQKNTFTDYNAPFSETIRLYLDWTYFKSKFELFDVSVGLLCCNAMLFVGKYNFGGAYYLHLQS
jgi:hypothetical protein